ncbi:MAG: thioesterase family protein [Rhodoferax sp.]|nr:thioesterase family protein [Rhodoferax sp.]MBP9931354.1 thioesterase family protein [Rhodoferax sp.]
MSDPAASSLLSTWRGTVLAQWVDYNGHLNDGYYMVVFSEATTALMAMIGLDDAGRKATGHSMFTLESHINYLQEVKQGKEIAVQTQILGSDAKRLQIYQTMVLAGTGTLLAANEQMLMNIDMSGPRAAPFASTVMARVQMLTVAHRSLPRPKYAGRVIALPGG